MDTWEKATRTSVSSAGTPPAPLVELAWCFACDDVLVVPRDDGDCCKACREDILQRWPD